MSFHLMVFISNLYFDSVLFTNDVIDACQGRQGINDQLPKGLKNVSYTIY